MLHSGGYLEAHAMLEMYLHICHYDFPSSYSYWSVDEALIVSYLSTLLNQHKSSQLNKNDPTAYS